MNSAIMAIAKEIKPPGWNSTVRLACAINLEASLSPCIVSIYSNYDLAKAPSEAFIEKLGLALGASKKPRWYLDTSEVTWRCWS